VDWLTFINSYIWECNLTDIRRYFMTTTKAATAATAATSKAVLAIYESGTETRFSSIRSASRALSGNGSDRLSTSIRRRLNAGGGYVGNNHVWVEPA